jgi:hypothetical protein
MAKGKPASAKKFFEKLGGDIAGSYVFTGMIKQHDSDDGIILFARPDDCATWIEVPVGVIKDIDFLQTAQCGDHKHPLVHLTMEEPQSEDGRAFAALARLHIRPMSPASAPPPAQAALAMSMAPRGMPGSTPCYWDWSLNRWVCPPV